MTEQVNERAMGHPGRSYISPPQDLESLRELAAALLSLTGPLPPGTGPWRRAVAGGQRIVTISALSDPPPMRLF